MITVAGGIYSEKCIEPYWNDVFGSAGRAAAAISGAIPDVKVKTYRAEQLIDGLNNLEAAFGMKIDGPSVGEGVSFEYVHSLADPRISPRPDAIPVNGRFDVVDEVVLRFGMLEGTAKVTADIAVYDPQSAFDPRPFGENGSSAKKLALMLNRLEGQRLTGEADLEKITEALIQNEAADVVILKMGGYGARVISGGKQRTIPAYKSDSVWKIGSGDVFSAAFTLFWAIEKRDPFEAADLASRATCYYCNTKALPIPTADELMQLNLVPVNPSKGQIYIAAPFFNLAERWLVEEVRTQLLQMGAEVFSPLHDVGEGPAEKVTKLDLEGLDDCQAVLAIFNGGDAGTIFEVGYAVAKGIPVVVLAQNVRPEDLKMPDGSGCRIVGDLVSAIYHSVWAIK